MKKYTLLALALSAVTTGLLISCAKPADVADGKDSSDKPDNKPDNSGTDKTQDSSKTENKTDNADTPNKQDNGVSDSKANIKEKASSIPALDIPPEQLTSYLQHVNKDIIRELYANSAMASKKLQNKSKELCQSGDVKDKDLDTLRESWLSVATAWAQSEVVNYGPAYDNMAHLYINYFPDERGLVHKNVAGLVKDNPTLNQEQFADQSAIVQGIPALEDILYTNDQLDQAQCAYVMSASAELGRRLQEISEQWQQNGETLLDTSNPKVGMNQYLNGLLFHIENLKSTGIAKPLALNVHKKGHVPAHTSKQSRAVITAKVDVLQQTVTDPTLAKLLDGNGEVLTTLTKSLIGTQTQLADMPADISTAEKVDQQVLYDNLTDVTKQIKRQLMPLLDVQVGFNSTDGD